MTKIAITSASGKLGGAIVRECINALGADNVIGLARTPSKAQSLGVEVRPGDYNAPGELESSLAGIDAVLLVSGMDAPEKRIDQHRNVIGAAKNAGVQKIVYTSIQGFEQDTGFSPVVQSNRQTESDVRECGLQWVIGRNGVYIEPDVEYIDSYKDQGEIANCAGDGKCGYTTRPELAFAYSRLLTGSKHDGQTYNLHGTAITQSELAQYLSAAFGCDLAFRSMSVDEYRRDRIDQLGDFMGTVIAGIYEGIRAGAMDNESHYKLAAGRDHQDWPSFFDGLK